MTTTVSKNIVWLTASRISALVLLAVAYIFLFRYLGPEGAGKHQFVLSFVTIFGVIIDFGIQQYIIKKMSEEPGRIKTYFQNFLAVEILLALCVYGTMILIASLNNYEPVILGAIIVAGLGTVINGLTYPFLSVMSANNDLKKVALINFMNSMVNVIIITLTIVFHKYIVFLVTNQFIFGVLSLILYSQFIKKHVPKPEIFKALFSVDSQLIKKILISAIPFALLVGFSTIYNRIDSILIFKMLGARSNGLYASAYRFFDLLAFFPSVVSFSLYPVFAGLMARKDLPSVRETFEKYLRFLLALALPIGVGGMLLSKQIILLLAGPEFVSASIVLSVLVWAPAILIIYIVANSLVISQLTKFAVMITATNVAINIIGNLILLPKIGIVAAAIMTVISEFLQGVFYFYFVHKKITKFSFLKFLWQPVLAASIMGLVLYPLKDLSISSQLGLSLASIPAIVLDLLSLVLIGIVVYSLVLYIIRFFKAEDKTFIKTLFKASPVV